MTEIRAGDVEGLLRRTDPGYPIFLVFGPDAGLVSERARRLAHAAVDDPEDSFQLVRLDGDDLASDPMKLVDEANTRALFGEGAASGSRPQVATWRQPSSLS
jgi:DNA polymerase-3 subunit delta